MLTVNAVLLLLAFLCFIASAFGVNSSRVNLASLGLALWVLTALISGAVIVRT